MNRIVIFLSILYLTTCNALGQGAKVSLNKSQMTARELINTIQSQTPYSFAFSDNTIDTSASIDLDLQEYTLTGLLDEITKKTGCGYVIRNRFILLNVPEPPPPVEVKIVELNDEYILSDDSHIAREPAERPHYTLPDTIVLEERVVYEIPELEWKKPYSDHKVSDIYYMIMDNLPKYLIKTNALQLLTLNPNLGIEFGITKHTSLELSGSYLPWKKSNDVEKDKFTHWMVRPEFRYWFTARFSGQYIGIHPFYAGYKISGYSVPLLFKKHNGYEGHALGAGVSYGYNLPLSKHWGMEFTVGVGVARLSYDKYVNKEASKVNKTYVGPTRIGINVVYILK